jgi:hypothetical protein
MPPTEKPETDNCVLLRIVSVNSRHANLRPGPPS